MKAFTLLFHGICRDAVRSRLLALPIAALAMLLGGVQGAAANTINWSARYTLKEVS